MKSLFVCSSQLGCPTNLDWTTQLHNWAQANDWTFREAEHADAIIVVCCSILVEYRKSVKEAVAHLARSYPDKKLIVTGCFLDADIVDSPNVVRVPMMRDTAAIDAALGAASPLREASSVSTPEMDAKVRELKDPKSVFDRPYSVLVETGCLSRCLYCVEKELFPQVKSVPLDEVVARCREGLRKGYTNFIIGGTDISSYGHDTGSDVVALFDALFTKVFKGRTKARLGFKALEPSRFIKRFDELKRHFKGGKIDWIYLPIESGSDKVLRAMGRPYKAGEVLEVVAELRTLAPKLRIETDFVFCYPTETAEDFDASLKLLDRFDHRNLVVFGRHENTAASAMKDCFDAAEKERRLKVIAEINASQTQSYRPECCSRDEVPLGTLRSSGLYVLAKPAA